MSSSWGRNIRVTVFGQSHSAAVGAVVEGLPAGFPVDMDRLSAFMARRSPGKSPLSTARGEADEIEFLGGLARGRLCGAPLAFMIRNTNARPGDYSEFTATPRPGHADWTAAVKYGGFQDASGGGHFSARLTAPLTAAGGVCMQILERLGVFIGAHIAEIAGERDAPFDPVNVDRRDFDARVLSPLTVRDAEAGERMARAIERARADGDSVGGVVECAACGLPAGVGGPMFGALESALASIVFAIPAVKGVEFGSGFAAARMTGSAHNDPFVASGGAVRTATNNHGGILGGIASGMPLVFRAAFKPTPSIAKAQRTLNVQTMTETELRVGGRHDPCVVPRAVAAVEAVAAVALCDALLPGDYGPLKN